MTPTDQAEPSATTKPKAKRKRPPAANVEPVLTSIRGAGTMLGLGDTSVWHLIKAQKLRVVRIGSRGGRCAGRTLVVVESIHQLIAQLEAEAAE